MKSAHTSGQLFSLGRINADYQARVERWPDPSETLVAKDFLVAGGGKGANVAYMAHHFGAMVQLIGRVGSDRLREQAINVDYRVEFLELIFVVTVTCLCGVRKSFFNSQCVGKKISAGKIIITSKK